MKKSLICLIIIAVVIAALAGTFIISASAAPRITPSLSVKDGVADCGVSVVALTKDIDVTMTLTQDGEVIKEWTENRNSRIFIGDKVDVEYGYAYVLTVSGTIDGVAFVPVSVTPAGTVTAPMAIYDIYKPMSDEELRGLYSKYLRGETDVDYWEALYIQKDLKAGQPIGTAKANEEAFKAQTEASFKAAEAARAAAVPRLTEEEQAMSYEEIMEKYAAEDKYLELGRILYSGQLDAQHKEAYNRMHYRAIDTLSEEWLRYINASNIATRAQEKARKVIALETGPLTQGMTEEQAAKYSEKWNELAELYGEELFNGYLVFGVELELENSPKLTRELVEEIIETKGRYADIYEELKKYPSNFILTGNGFKINSRQPYEYGVYFYAFEDGSVLMVKEYYGYYTVEIISPEPVEYVSVMDWPANSEILFYETDIETAVPAEVTP